MTYYSQNYAGIFLMNECVGESRLDLLGSQMLPEMQIILYGKIQIIVFLTEQLRILNLYKML